MDLYATQFSLLHLLMAVFVGIVIGGWLGRRAGGGATATTAPRFSSSSSSTAGSSRAESATIDGESAAVERSIGKLSARARRDIDALIAEDRLIEAIRDVRKETGLGLKEAKDIVDRLAHERTFARKLH